MMPIAANIEGTMMAGFVHHRPLSSVLSPFVPLVRAAGVWVSLPLGRVPASGPSLMGLVSALTRRIAATLRYGMSLKPPYSSAAAGSLRRPWSGGQDEA